MSNKKRYNICTLAKTPRLPEHCIEYIYLIDWEKDMKGKKFDSDSKEDMTWIYDRALKRAEKFGIKGVTYSLTMGVLKNIIPAVATTNAIIAANCVNETLKIGTSITAHLDNEIIFQGQSGIYGNTYKFETLTTCVVCHNAPIRMERNENTKLEELIDELKAPPYSLKNPSVTSSCGSLYMSAPASLEEQLRPNLELTFK